MHTSAPVPAKIFISGHDIDRSEVYSDTITGRFIRMLSPGTWNLTFSANGYIDTTINNVSVAAGQRTDLLVEMKSIISTIDTTIPVAPLLYPNPSVNTIYAKLPQKLTGNINIKIISSSGMKVADYFRNNTFGNPMQIDISRLPGGSYTIIFTNNTSGVSYKSRFVALGQNF
jgi:hypothetical protein